MDRLYIKAGVKLRVAKLAFDSAIYNEHTLQAKCIVALYEKYLESGYITKCNLLPVCGITLDALIDLHIRLDRFYTDYDRMRDQVDKEMDMDYDLLYFHFFNPYIHPM